MSGFTGGCQCSRVRYTLQTKSYTVYACHCRECQKQSASAFALSVPVPIKALNVEGTLNIYERPTDRGSLTHCYFCPQCGTRIYHQSKRSPDIVTLKGGTLDDASKLEPIAHLWIRSKQPWLLLPKTANTALYETQPENLKKWRDTLLAPID